jgi:outer membrane autotransporter protein
MLALLCSTALAGASLWLIAAPTALKAQALYGATGGQPTPDSGVGGDAGEDGGDGTGTNAGSGGAAGTAVNHDGVNGGDGDTGGGGGGGYSPVISGDIVVDSLGGNGGAGGRGTVGFVVGGGGGGGGGDGARNADANPGIHVQATVRGGNGGAGGGGMTGSGASGGGGAGFVLENIGTVTIDAGGRAFGGNGGGGVYGGGGGAGIVLDKGGTLTTGAGSSVAGGDGGTYAEGGAGVISAGSVALTNSGEITGGKGGQTNAGAAGVSIAGGGSVLNTGTIRGGAGGAGGTSGYSGLTGGKGSGGAPGFQSNLATVGAGGAGIVGAGLAVMNAGTIAGGTGFTGQANAITFTGGDNTLSLRNGSTIIGNVVVESGAVGTLMLGDYDTLPGTPAFDVSRLVDTATAGATDEFVGFTSFVKNGPNSVTLSGTGTQDWSIDEGTLVGDTNSFGGDLTFGTGAGTRGVVFKQDNDGAYSGAISGDGTFSKTGPGTLTLTGASAFDGHTGVAGGTLAITDGGTVSNGDGLIAFGTGSVAGVNVAGQGSIWSNDNLIVGYDGTGELNVTGGGEVNSSLTATIGGFPDHYGTGTATVSGAGSVWNSANLAVGYNGEGELTIANGGEVNQQDAYIGSGLDGVGTVLVIGTGSKWISRNSLTVGSLGAGDLTVEAGGSVESVTGSIGAYPFPGSQGTATVSGDGSVWNNSGDLSIGGESGMLTVTAGGAVSAGGGVTLGSGVGDNGTLTIGTVAGKAATAAGVLTAPTLEFGNGSGTLVFNHTDTNYAFSAALQSTGTGAHAIDHEAGTTSLTGDNSGFAGATTVAGGTLKVNGALGGTATVENGGTLIVGDDSHSAASLAGDVDVRTGGTLGGSGTIGGNATVDGTLSAGNSPGTLTINGDLTLNSGSTSIFELNTPGVAGGTGNDLVNVHDNLTLGGALDARVAAAGYYRLFNYDGMLTGTFDSGTVTGTGGFTPLFPNNPAIRYDTPGQVNLSVLAAGQTMLFWDGANTSANGTVDGGDGTWTSAGANWTDSAGGANGGWNGSVGVFAGSAGTVTVDGTQSFDTLQFKTDGYTLTGGTLALSPAAGTAGALNIDNGVSTTITTVIADGTGTSLKKVGGGTLVLKGSNTYTGGTQLSSGMLSVSSDANLGDAVGDLTFDGGTLRNTAALATARDVTLDAGGGTFQADADLALNGMISGAGSLTKAGAGVLTLSNANSYDGGTTILQGQLTAAATGALGTGAVDVEDSAALAFINDNTSAGDLAITLGDHSTIRFNDASSAGTVTIANAQGYINFYDTAAAGSATIVNDFGGTSFNAHSSAGNADITAKNNGTIDFYDTATAGTATLTSMADGLIRFHGDTTADDATVVGKAGGLIDISDLTSSGIGIGSLSSDGEVVLGSKALTLGGLGKDDTIGGTIEDGTDGTGGSLVKTGTGTLTLNGMNTYTGLTMITDGKLVVGDDGHATASLAGGVLVNDGGTLGGIGTVGSTTVASGGTIAPGNSIGTLTVKGDIAFDAGSAYLAEINPALDSDLIDASGRATIGGGTVYALKAAGVYAPGSRWTIVGAGGGVTGTFDALDQNMPFVDLALAYDANHVYIDAARNGVAFCDVAMTFNQCSTGDGLESTGGGNPVYDAVAALPDAGSARVALDALSGEIYASARSALIEDSHFVRDAVNKRIRSAFGDPSAPALSVMAYGEGGPRLVAPDSAGPVAWGHAFGAWGSFDGDGNAAAMDTATGGFLAGVDGEVASGVRLGLLAGYSHSTFDVDARASSGSSDNYHLGLYAGGRWDALRLSGGLAYAWHDIETGRSVAFPGFGDRLTGDYSAGTFQAFGEAGYRIGMGAVSIEPFANLAYVNLTTDGFTEKGGAAALAVHGETTEATFTTLGLHLSSTFDLGGMTATARGTFGWRHAFGDVTPTSIHAFAGGDAFTVAGVPIAKDAALVEAGLDLDLSEAATFGIAYQGQFGDGAMQNGLNANLRVGF